MLFFVIILLLNLVGKVTNDFQYVLTSFRFKVRPVWEPFQISYLVICNEKYRKVVQSSFHVRLRLVLFIASSSTAKRNLDSKHKHQRSSSSTSLQLQLPHSQFYLTLMSQILNKSVQLPNNLHL